MFIFININIFVGSPKSDDGNKTVGNFSNEEMDQEGGEKNKDEDIEQEDEHGCKDEEMEQEDDAPMGESGCEDHEQKNDQLLKAKHESSFDHALDQQEDKKVQEEDDRGHEAKEDNECKDLVQSQDVPGYSQTDCSKHQKGNYTMYNFCSSLCSVFLFLLNFLIFIIKTVGFQYYLTNPVFNFFNFCKL